MNEKNINKLIVELQEYKNEVRKSKTKSRKLLKSIGILDKNNKLTEFGANVVSVINMPNKYNQNDR